MKGEKGIKILAPAPYKVQEEREKIDPATQKPVIGADGKAVTETVEVLRPAFKVVSVFDVSQTDGKELPDIIVDELKGTVENYEAFFDALKQESPVPISFEDIPGGAKGFFSSVESRIAIQEDMSEIQTVKTAIHEIAHAKLHAVKPDEKAAPEDKKDRHTKEVEAESVAYTVCQRYGIETSDYSFGYIAGWSSGKETKELKSSLDTIRKTAAEMIEGIDAKLKVLLAEKAQSAEMEVEAPVKETVSEEKPEVPIYRETANYAYEAGELESYRASLAANVECRRAIEAAISSNYGDNRLDADAAVKSVLEQFSPERVRYVLANTIQQKDFDGRIPQALKEWAKSVEVCPENASRFLVDRPNPGLTALFVDAFRQQTEPQKEVTSEKAEERDPEVVAWENDEITSIEVKTVEVKSPFAPLPEEAAKAPKAHRLTAEEKEIKAAVMDTLKGRLPITTTVCGRPIAPLTTPSICWRGTASKSRATRSRRMVSRCSKSIAVMRRGKRRAVTVSCCRRWNTSSRRRSRKSLHPRSAQGCRKNTAGEEVSGQIQNARHGVVRKETHEEIHRR